MSAITTLVPKVLTLWVMAIAMSSGAQVQTPSIGMPANTPTQAVGAEAADAPQLVAPDATRAIVRDFLQASTSARVYVMDQLADSVDGAGQSGMKLTKIWSGEAGILLEIHGLQRAANAPSAMIRRQTLRLLGSNGTYSDLIRTEGASQLVDRKGGSAIYLRPGEVMHAWFAKVDDFRPFSLEHTVPGSMPLTYFERIDPRFRERYDASFAKANAAQAEPDDIKDFLTDFAKADPDKRAPGVFLKLIERMRGQNSFEGYYNAYLLIEQPVDAKQAQRLATNDEHRTKLEHLAVTALTDKSRLFSMAMTLEPSATRSAQGGCWMFCEHNFTATRAVGGSISLKGNAAGSPIRLKQGVYDATVTVSVEVPRQAQQRSNTIWVGSFDKRDDVRVVKDFKLTLRPPSYEATVPFALGSVAIAFLNRGSAGGYTVITAIGNPVVTAQLKSLELARWGDLHANQKP